MGGARIIGRRGMAGVLALIGGYVSGLAIRRVESLDLLYYTPRHDEYTYPGVGSTTVTTPFNFDHVCASSNCMRQQKIRNNPCRPALSPMAYLAVENYSSIDAVEPLPILLAYDP